MERDRDDVIAAIAKRDSRFRPDAFAFVLESLDFTIGRRGKGRKHVSGPELLEGFRDHAIATFGLLARAVLAEWGISSTADVGEVVFLMIEEDLLQKTADDRREDFHDVFDFADAFDEGYRESLASRVLL